MSVNIIDVSGVTKTFGSVTAVDNVTFSVPKGSITALLGPNGAGKTTLLRMILGFARPSAGVISYHETQPRIGASLDGGWGSKDVSAAQDWCYVARVLGVSSDAADIVRERVGLSKKDMRKPVAKFSTGMRQRYGLGVALLGDPDLLVLDEPVNGLDPEGIRWLRDLMKSFADAGGTVLLSSHLLGEVAHVADHLVVLRQNIRFAGPVHELDASLSPGDLESQYFALINSERNK